MKVGLRESQENKFFYQNSLEIKPIGIAHIKFFGDFLKMKRGLELF